VDDFDYCSWQGQRLTSSVKLNDGNWHYVVATYKSGVLSLYADGQLVASASGVSLPAMATSYVTSGCSGLNPCKNTVAAPLTLGAAGTDPPTNYSSPEALTGNLADVAIYGSDLSTAQVTEHWMDGLDSICPATPTTAYAAAVVQDHPVRYYPLDEQGGALAEDLSGHCQPAAYTAATQHETGPVADGGAIAGAGSLVASGGPMPWTTADQAWSVDAWVQTTASGWQPIISQGYGCNEPGFELSLDNGVLQYNTFGEAGLPGDDFDYCSSQGQRLTSSVKLNDGNWHYVAVSYQGGTATAGGTLTFYVDGQAVAWANGVTLPAMPAAPLLVGVAGTDPPTHYSSPEALTGSVADLAIYHVGLSQAQVTEHWTAGIGASCPATPTTGYAGAVAKDDPLAFYRFNETGGSLAADSSGHCQPAAYTATTTYGSGPNGDGAISGTGSLVVSGSQLPWTTAAGNAWSIEAWVQTTATGWQPILSQGWACGTGFELSVYDGTLQFNVSYQVNQDSIGLQGDVFAYCSEQGRQLTSSESPLNNGVWHYVAATYKSDVLTLYVDGAQVAWANGVTLPAMPAAPLLVGVAGTDPPTNYSSPEALNGSVADLAIYNGGLTPAQITAHWTKRS
jgi:hypothetical protein